MKHAVLLKLDDVEVEALAALALCYAVGATANEDKKVRAAKAILHMIGCAVDGVRRPGAWERGVLQSMFGDVESITEPHEDGVPWHTQPRKS